MLPSARRSGLAGRKGNNLLGIPSPSGTKVGGVLTSPDSLLAFVSCISGGTGPPSKGFPPSSPSGSAQRRSAVRVADSPLDFSTACIWLSYYIVRESKHIDLNVWLIACFIVTIISSLPPYCVSGPRHNRSASNSPSLPSETTPIFRPIQPNSTTDPDTESWILFSISTSLVAPNLVQRH